MMSRDASRSALLDDALRNVANRLDQTEVHLLGLLERLEPPAVTEEEPTRPIPAVLQPTFAEETAEIESMLEPPPDSLPITSPSSTIITEEPDDHEDVVVKTEERVSSRSSDESRLSRLWQTYSEGSDPEMTKNLEMGAAVGLAVLLVGLIQFWDR